MGPLGVFGYFLLFWPDFDSVFDLKTAKNIILLLFFNIWLRESCFEAFFTPRICIRALKCFVFKLKSRKVVLEKYHIPYISELALICCAGSETQQTIQKELN